MHKVWHKRVYPKIPGIGESTPETVVETMIQSETCVPTFHNTFLPHNCVPLSQYLEFLGKLFCAILYAYCGVCSMLVPQNFMCNASVIAVNLSTYQIGFHAVNLEGCVVNSFEPCSIHIRLYDTTSTNIFISGNMYCG
jgi:hypothetical protein